MTNEAPLRPHDNGGSAHWPRPHDLRAALGLLTALPFDRPDVHSDAAARATLFFPVVGGGIGLLLAGSNWAIGDRLPALLGALVLVGLWEAITGGEGLRACGSLSARRMGGHAVVVTVALCKVAALALPAAGHSVAGRPAALLFAPMLARWAMVVLAVGARDAAAPMRKFNPAITFREFALTSVFTCAIVFTVAEAFGILLVVGVAALTLTLRVLQHRRPGGTSWPLLLAGAELVELLVLGIAGVTGHQ